MTDRLVPHSNSVSVPTPLVGLSTSSVYPEPTPVAFELAKQLGYDGVEIMVWGDPISQDIGALRGLSDDYQLPILSVHAPCLVVTQRVWTTDPWEKLERAKNAAERLNAHTVVVHPPFRWQREYARGFKNGIARMAQETDIRFAVENMFPLRIRGREMASAYSPGWNPLLGDYSHYTLDVSHAAVSRIDALELCQQMGDRLSHVHIADGTGLAKDEHLVPGRGTQRCDEFLELLAVQQFSGAVIVEINTRRARDRDQRVTDLAQALAFTRLHLASPGQATSQIPVL